MSTRQRAGQAAGVRAVRVQASRGHELAQPRGERLAGALTQVGHGGAGGRSDRGAPGSTRGRRGGKVGRTRPTLSGEHRR